MRDKIAEEAARQGQKAIESFRLAKERNKINFFEVKR